MKLLLHIVSLQNYVKNKDVSSLVQIFTLFREFYFQVEKVGGPILYLLSKVQGAQCLIYLELKMKLEFLSLVQRVILVREKIFASKVFDNFFEIDFLLEQDYILFTFFLQFQFLRLVCKQNSSSNTILVEKLRKLRDDMNLAL